MLNHYPTKGGISDTLSPRTLVLGLPLDHHRDFRLTYGDYCQVHEHDTPRNSQAARIQGAICLGPANNTQGGFYFMSLRSGEKITRYSWTLLPMPDTVIDRVNILGLKEPEFLSFADRRGRPLGELDAPTVDPADALTGVDDGLHAVPEPPSLITGVGEVTTVPMDELADAPTAELGDDPDPDEPEPPLVLATEPALAPTSDITVAPMPDIGDEATVRRSGRARAAPPTHYFPSFSGQKYAMAQLPVQHPDAHMAFFQREGPPEPTVVASVMTQLSLKVGLKQWGWKAKDAAYSEMKQLHFRNKFTPLLWSDIPENQLKTVLKSHMFLKLKRDGKIKGRTVAGGNKQRDYISKEDASSLTVATEAVLLTCIVDAEEGRDVAVIDIPNAFIQTKIDDEADMAIIKIRGILTEMLVEIAPGRRLQRFCDDRQER
jgi:hypothetical protein